MTRKLNICVDLRREPNCGVGRVAFNVASLLLELSRDFELEISGLIFPEQRASIHAKFPEIQTVETAAHFLSREELLELPQELSSVADVFWAPQFYVSPFFEIPVIAVIHDTWPATSPEWLPNHEEVIRRYGSDAIELAHELVNHFEVTHLRSVNPEILDIYEQRSSILDKYMLAMMYMCAVQSLLIITVSEYSRGQIVKLMPMCAGKVYVLSPFVREHRLARQPASHIDRLLMVAKLDPRKNHVLVLHALAELFALRRCARPIEVHFVGEIGYRSFGKELVEIGERLSTATQRIIFHDLVSDDALNQLYAECDLLLFPSFDEGFGLPVLEALETGLAVLAAARGGVPEVAGPFASYCSVDSPAALATEINRALDSKDRMNQMASAGRADVMLRFSRDRSVAQLRNILFASRDRMGAINESR